MKPIEKYKTDLIIESRIAYRQAILSLLEPDPNARLLDIGCGTGKLTRMFIQRLGCKVATGVDTESAEYSQLKVDRYDLNEGLPYTSDSFDVIVASHVLEHLWHTDIFMRDLRRVLKPSGYAVISTPNLASWHNAFYLIAGRQPETSTISDEMYPWKERPGHRRVFTATELLKFCEFHKLAILDIIGTSYYPLLGKTAAYLARKDWRHSGITTIKVAKI